ncbi:MAG: HU family DNA-binding protein, partial [Candidatus Thiodiazotropha taylori]|nr:HU family DNA-binding protein [Candidatus Thiodiazotropha taylori]MCW4251461.1 HU family DNA-binding protein [Candidatus Thiodiazotropha taylori]
MNKAELIEAMAESADISKAAAGRALDGMVNAVTEAMKAGDTLSLVGFGT